MPSQTIQSYWEPSFETFYDSYFQELASEQLIARLQRLDFGIGFLVALTASGSALSGWALWHQDGWKLVWAAIAGTAGVAAILHRLLTVPSRLKEQEELWRMFVEIRVDSQTFRQNLLIGIEEKQAKAQFDSLRGRFSKCMARTRRDIVLTKRMREKIQYQLNDRIKDQIHQDEDKSKYEDNSMDSSSPAAGAS